jgi:hypothetical protein
MSGGERFEFVRRVMEYDHPSRGPRNTVRLRLGRWIEARGTGWGVAVVPVLVVVIALLLALRWGG